MQTDMFIEPAPQQLILPGMESCESCFEAQSAPITDDTDDFPSD